MSAMKNYGRYLLLLCAIGLAAPPALAQKVGTTSMQFLKVMPCARGAAMGDAYTVLAAGADAVFWNPSGVALVENKEFSSTYLKWIFDTQQGALSFAMPVGDIGAFALQIQYIDYGTIEETSLLSQYMQNADQPGMTGNTFRPYAYLVGVTYARSLTDKFSTGISVKYAHESLFNGQTVNTQVRQGAYQDVKTWTNGLLFDFGVRYNTGYKTIQIGASVQNFGADVTYAKDSNPVPLLFRFGAAADLVGPDALLLPMENNRITVAFDLFQPNDYDQQQHIGVEYEFAKTFALRAGYKVHYDTEGLTLGAGIRHTVGSVPLSLDYSYGSVGTYLGNGQRISLGAELP